MVNLQRSHFKANFGEKNYGYLWMLGDGRVGTSSAASAWGAKRNSRNWIRSSAAGSLGKSWPWCPLKLDEAPWWPFPTMLLEFGSSQNLVRRMSKGKTHETSWNNYLCWGGRVGNLFVSDYLLRWTHVGRFVGCDRGGPMNKLSMKAYKSFRTSPADYFTGKAMVFTCFFLPKNHVLPVEHVFFGTTSATMKWCQLYLAAPSRWNSVVRKRSRSHKCNAGRAVGPSPGCYLWNHSIKWAHINEIQWNSNT